MNTKPQAKRVPRLSLGRTVRPTAQAIENWSVVYELVEAEQLLSEPVESSVRRHLEFKIDRCYRHLEAFLGVDPEHEYHFPADYEPCGTCDRDHQYDLTTPEAQNESLQAHLQAGETEGYDPLWLVPGFRFGPA